MRTVVCVRNRVLRNKRLKTTTRLNDIHSTARKRETLKQLRKNNHTRQRYSNTPYIRIHLRSPRLGNKRNKLFTPLNNIHSTPKKPETGKQVNQNNHTPKRYLEYFEERRDLRTSLAKQPTSQESVIRFQVCSVYYPVSPSEKLPAFRIA